MARPSMYKLNRERVLEAIEEAHAGEGVPPTVRELSKKTRISVSTLHSYITRMHEDELVTWQPKSHRSIKVTAKGRDLIS